MKSLVAGIALSFVATAAFAGPAVTTEWVEQRLSLEDCKSKVSASLRSNGFANRDIETKTYSVFAHQRDYTISVRCMPDQGVVFFIATGAQLKQADRLLDDLIGEFKRRN